MAWNETQSGKELPNYPSISRTVMKTWQMLVFGAVSLGMGVISSPLIHKEVNGHNHAPVWVFSSIGTLYGLVGLLMVFYGVIDLRSESRKRRAAQTHPNESWRGDYDWAPASSLRGMSSRDDRLWWTPVFGLQVVILMAVVSNWLTIDEWGQGIHSYFLAFMSLVMNLVVLLVCGLMIRGLIMRLKFGPPRIVFDRVPIRPGDTFSARVVTRGLQRADRIEMTFREVTEEYIKRETQRGHKPKQLVKCAELRASELVVEDVRSQLAGDGTLAVGFDVPSDAQSNALSDRPARFWDLEVRGVMRGVDFVHRFAVPVYAQD